MGADTDNPVAKPPVIRAVILDFGEVLCHLPSAETIERLALLFQMDPRTFLPIYLETRAPYDRGDLLAGEYWQKFAEQAGVKITANAIEQARQLDLELWSHINDAMILWVQQLHAAGFRSPFLGRFLSRPVERFLELVHRFRTLLAIKEVDAAAHLIHRRHELLPLQRRDIFDFHAVGAVLLLLRVTGVGQ